MCTPLWSLPNIIIPIYCIVYTIFQLQSLLLSPFISLSHSIVKVSLSSSFTIKFYYFFRYVLSLYVYFSSWFRPSIWIYLSYLLCNLWFISYNFNYHRLVFYGFPKHWDELHMQKLRILWESKLGNLVYFPPFFWFIWLILVFMRTLIVSLLISIHNLPTTFYIEYGSN